MLLDFSFTVNSAGLRRASFSLVLVSGLVDKGQTVYNIQTYILQCNTCHVQTYFANTQAYKVQIQALVNVLVMLNF